MTPARRAPVLDAQPHGGSTPPPPALLCRNLTVSYGERPALSDLSAAVRRGGWLALIGPNGAGKSTLLRAVAGLVAARGELLVCGAPLDTASRRRVARLVALVPQRPQLPQTMTVYDYVLLGRTAHLPLLAAERPKDRRIAAAAIERLDLASLAERPLGSLSGGEAQRATLARAVTQEAPLLLLDEPTSSLDLGHEQQVLELVDELRAERGLSVVSAMHDLTLAGQYAEELLLLAGGRVVASGRPEDVLVTSILEHHYEARLEVLPRHGSPVVLPLRPRTRPPGRPETQTQTQTETETPPPPPSPTAHPEPPAAPVEAHAGRPDPPAAPLAAHAGRPEPPAAPLEAHAGRPEPPAAPLAGGPLAAALPRAGASGASAPRFSSTLRTNDRSP